MSKLTTYTIHKIIQDIDFLIETNNYCKNVPEFQTWPDLHLRKESWWQLVIKSLTLRCTLLFGHNNFYIQKMWSYVNISGKSNSQNYNTLWHVHESPSNQDKKICAIMPIFLPLLSGLTEFRVNDLNFFLPYQNIGDWVFFKPDIMHRPSIWNNDNGENRYMLSASVIYND